MSSLGVINPIQVVRDGKGAIEYLEGKGLFADRTLFPHPAALFLDMRMPGTDGWEVLRWLHQRQKTDAGEMLVIVLSAYGDRQRLQEAYYLGAHSFLYKPLDPREVANILCHWPEAWILNPTHALDAHTSPKPKKPFPPGKDQEGGGATDLMT